MPTYNAGQLARGWLSVAVAAANDPERPALHKTVYLEQFSDGLRLSATDSYMLLIAWVPAEPDDLAPDPGLDAAPVATAVAQDEHGRGAGLLAHLLKLEKEAAKKDEPLPSVSVRLGDRSSTKPQQTLSEMEATAVVLAHPDHEQVRLSCFEGIYPDWRKVVSGFAPVTTTDVALSPSLLTRLVKAVKLHPTGVVVWTWGGPQKAAHVVIGHGEPDVRGLVMPVRWDFDRDAPYVPPPKDEDSS